MAKAKSLPINTVRIGNISCSVWDREGTNKNGEIFTSYNASLQSSYKDETGTVRFTDSINERDMLNAAACLEKAFWNIKEIRSKTKEIK